MDQIPLFADLLAATPAPARASRQPAALHQPAAAAAPCPSPVTSRWDAGADEDATDGLDDLFAADLPPLRWTEAEIRELRVAILEQALEELNRDRAHDVVQRMAAWIHGPDALGPFGFEACCLAAGLDPDLLRGGLRHIEPRVSRS